MTIKWDALQEDMDNVIDDILGEDVEIHPMVPGDYGHSPISDPLRPVVRARAVKVGVGAAVTGEGAGFFNTRTLADDIWVSIQERFLGSTIYNRPDRVYFIDRDQWYEVSWMQPSTTFRPNFHLIRVQDNDLPLPGVPVI